MSRPRIVIVGAGFAGYRAARVLSRLTRHKADITLLNPTDYFLYLPLLPQVAAGILEPRRVTVSLTGTLPDVRLVLGEADAIDLDGQTVRYTGPEGEGGTLPYDRLILAAGSVNKLLPIPGVAEHAHGFRGLPEALYLRDHVTRQMELAAAADDPASCSARCTFVVVGAGYTGTEVAAQGKLFTDSQVRRRPLRAGVRPRWLLLDIAERVLPELDENLSRTADRVLRQRGVEVRMGTSVKEATHRGVLLTDGEFVDTRTLVWCVGVRPDPLAESLGLPLEKGRLLVDPHLQVPGRPGLFAAGDAAAVPDLEKPGAYTPMTAQHAWRQGKAVAHNVAASLGLGERRAYRHRDLGFVVDLGGVKAAANPLGIPLSGVAAGAVTRGYHLAAMPGNRVRVAADWLLDAVLPRQAVQLGLVRSWSVPLDTASPELARVPGSREKAGAPREGSGPHAGEGTEAADRIQDPHAAEHSEPPGPVRQPDLPEGHQPIPAGGPADPAPPTGGPADHDARSDTGAGGGLASSDAPAVHKRRPDEPMAPAPPKPASSEGDT
ncbi:FAD-dependent oxidoreductase [Streptomyces sp. Y7]|uniref:NAD(P)/FAD-dependent oxidoreductase n=1 Tax=Streptomyces sp. Y7 TaxID=3342392 RepID=UPI003715D2B1